MPRHSLVPRMVASVALVAVLAAGTNAFIPAAFGCGSNAGGGNCKQASDSPAPAIDWSEVFAVVGGLRIYFGI